jgi:TPR repeat protein
MSMELLVSLLIVAAIIYLYQRHKRKKGEVVKTTADFKMGTDYAFGRGFPKMDELAANVFTIAAKEGDIDAYAALGNMYSRGIHFKKDYEEAVQARHCGAPN